jgi:hypothetical protein
VTTHNTEIVGPRQEDPRQTSLVRGLIVIDAGDRTAEIDEIYKQADRQVTRLLYGDAQ